MKSDQIKVLVLSLSLGIIFQGCSKDEVLNEAVNDAIQLSAEQGNLENFSSTDNDILRLWTDLLLEVDRNSVGMRPCGTARALAYIYLASYETAVPAMRGYNSMERRLQGFDLGNDRPGDPDINYLLALNTSFELTFDHFMRNIPAAESEKIDALAAQVESELSSGLSQQLVSASKDWGQHVATRVIAYSQTDEAGEQQILEPQPLSYEPPTGDGFWTYSADPERALFPYWGSVRTFVISPEQSSSIPPADYSSNPSSGYFAQMQEVYDVNNAAREDDGEQLWIAEFWSDDVEGLMFSPPVRQYSIANQLIDQYNIGLEEALGLYLKLGFSLNDAAVSTWDDKYEHMVMRPNVFIHEFIDSEFQTNLYRLVYWPNPSFPGYPSGHSCFASAAAGVFIDYFGNSTNFTDRSHAGRTEFRGSPRTFSSFEDMAEENAFSRIPLGVHIRMDCSEGLRLGYEIADAVNRLRLRGQPS